MVSTEDSGKLTFDAPLGRWQEVIGGWAERTFEQTTDGIIRHLYEETAELYRANLMRPRQDMPPTSATGESTAAAIQQEAADCLILLLALAHHEGFSLVDAVAMKHLVNAGRVWGEKDEDGIVHHIDH